MVTSKPNSQQNFTERKLLQGVATLAANAGSSQILGLSVPLNRQLVVRGILRASAGVHAGAIPVTVTNANETFTAATAHGFTGVVPCYIGGTAVPTGITASTLYYAWPTSTTAFQLYDTMANALTHNGSTGLIAVTTDGTAVTLTPTVVTAAYQIFGSVVNRNGYCVALGTPVIDALEAVAAWDTTISADDANDLLRVMFTPDTALQTKIEYFLEVLDLALAA